MPLAARPVFYDVTELVTRSGDKRKFYGIARVVEEIAVALIDSGVAVRFVAYSPGHGTFFELPSLPGDGRAFAASIPIVPQLITLRRIHAADHMLRDAVLGVIGLLVDSINRRRWSSSRAWGQPVSLDGGVFISAGRPKQMANMIRSIKAAGWSTRIHALLHDVIPLHHLSEGSRKPFHSNFGTDTAYVMRHADHIIANSAFTRQDLEAFIALGSLPRPPAMDVVALAHECPAATMPPNADLPSAGYLLSVGAQIGRKNLECVLNALLLLTAAGRSPPPLVLAGADRHHIHRFLAQERYTPIRDLVEFRISPCQADLIALYRGALALVMPSRIEGWGLPVGEALWNGTPVICSTAPVLREVAGDLALYFDPDRPDELADHITRLGSDAAFRHDLRQRIAAARSSLRTWADVAKEMMERVYANIRSHKEERRSV